MLYKCTFSPPIPRFPISSLTIPFPIPVHGSSDTRARPPSRTLVDPLAAFTATLAKGSFADAIKAAHEAADNTRHINATAGRGAYVDQEKLGSSDVPDPGAWGVWVILNALGA